MAAIERKSVLKKYNAVFQHHLQHLNEEQAQAVDNIDGPTLVIAGPGTGKTHILTARIGRILHDTDTQAHNILCLTFTDAGVYAMRERLLQLIGPEAHRVHIYTFHSFCNSVIQENMEYFGRHELEPLSELERIELIRNLIDSLPQDHLLRQRTNDVYFYERHLGRLFQQMKSENWTPDFIRENVAAYLSDLPTRKEFIYQRKTKEAEKGDLKKWKIEEEEAKSKLLLSAVDLYPRYVQMMQKAQRYDFDDMILWVLEAFKENGALLRNYQERYLYFLVDEYQDTNGAQNGVLQQLISYWESPNIFIVGDDDQSIFEFQGARLKNLSEFYQFYENDLSLVLLKDNYRSSQHILDSARRVIQENENRIVNKIGNLDKILRAQHPDFSDSSVLPSLLLYENRAQENAAIVEKIAKLHQQGVDLNEIAIIYARHQQARNIINLLNKKGIPYQTKRQVNILDLPLIQNIRTLLEYLSAEYDRPYSGESKVYQILSFPFFEVLPSDLAKLSNHLAAQHSRTKWRDSISSSTSLEKLDLEKPERILAVSRFLTDRLQDFQGDTLLGIVEKTFNKTGILSYILKAPDKDWLLQILSTFMGFIQKETDRNPRLSLKNLLHTFVNMDRNRLAIPLQKVVHALHGVNLVTAHSSKGLEYTCVFLIDAVQDFWEPARQRGAGSFSLPDTLTLSGEHDALEARRRLFYVAMTRAKEHLYISLARKKNTGKALERTRFLDEILADGKLEIEEATIDPKILIESQLLLMWEEEKPILPEERRAQNAKLLEGFTLSITSLNSFLRCPLSFYYDFILKIPAVQSEAASYGIAMHHALSKLFEVRNEDPAHRLPSVEETLKFFKGELRRQQSHFTKSEYERRLTLGEKNLRQYYAYYLPTWSEKIWVEYQIKNTEIDGVPITGTIDRIDFTPRSNTVMLIDYKTGKPSNRKFAKFSDKNPEGGLYRRQLLFYKILFESSQNEFFTKVGAISYFEADHKGDFTFKNIEYDRAEVELFRRLIKEAYTKIRNQEFYEGCGKDNCKWCNFVKNNIIPASFVDKEAEDLDD